nr:MAG TPA: hypothetical protein [Caudoviricetes sp.]DAM89991.1 MAG TPA: hypothetical protein [Caudoviricetes sp.]DAP44227.1 MAG TPA: hypothetical protein [Caudoviricetes sp.]
MPTSYEYKVIIYKNYCAVSMGGNYHRRFTKSLRQHVAQFFRV